MTTCPLPKRLRDLGTDHTPTPVQPGAKTQGQPQTPRLARETARKDVVCCLLRKTLKILRPTAVRPEAFHSLSLKRRQRDRSDFPWLLIAYTRKSQAWPPLQPRFLKLPADQLEEMVTRAPPPFPRGNPFPPTSQIWIRNVIKPSKLYISPVNHKTQVKVLSLPQEDKHS